MPSRFKVPALIAALLVCAPPSLYSQDTTLAGWTFSQFLGEGPPSISGETFEPVDRIVATYRGSFEPDSNLVDGLIVGINGTAGYDDASFGSWSFADFDTTVGFDVRADPFGSLNTQNSTTVDGTQMHLTDQQGLMLTFNRRNTLWTLTVADTTGYANAAGPDFTFAARGNGGDATVEWLFNNVVFATQTIVSGPNFATYALELPSGFYGNGVIQGRLTAGSVSFDNVQINGQLGSPPSFDTQPQSLVRLVGESATFTVAVSGATSPTYQWFKGAGIINGATSASLTIDPVSLASAGSYRVRVFSSNGLFADSAFAALEVRQAPAITRQPAAQVANPGQNVSFTVVATGTPAPVYRWQRDGADLFDGGNISGAATATLTVSGVTEADEGAYRVVVTNVVTAAESNAVSLSVTDVQIAPGVSTPPADTTGVVGGEVELTVVASGAPAPTYQWFFNDEPLVDGPGISGATAERLVLSGLTAERAGTYKVVVTNSAGTQEREAVLTVQTPPQIVSGPGPAERAAVAGSTVTFEVVATGDPVPTYQWLLNGEDIEGQTASTLVLTNVGAADNGAYSVRVINPADTLESATSVLSVGTAALITAHPQSAVVAAGGSIVLSVTATGNPAPSYQWFRNGQELPEETDRTLGLDDITAAAAGAYTVRVSNAFATEFSEEAEIAVAQVVDNARPNSTQVFTPGSALVLGSTMVSPSPLRFVWFRDGKRIPGADGPTLSLAGAGFADSGVYSVKVYNSAGRLVGQRVVSRVRISVAGVYDVPLRDSDSGDIVGLLRVNVARTGSFTGRLNLADGFGRAIRGRLEFPDQPYLGGRTLLLSRKNGPSLELVLSLDANVRSFGASLSEGDTPGGPTGEAGPRLSGPAEWMGRYSLALAPQGEASDEPALLSAKIARGGLLRLTGRLADGRRVTAAVPSSETARYATLAYPYGRGRGHLAGELVLENSPDGYFADENSSSLWRWRREARGENPDIDQSLSPSLAP